MPCIYCLRDDVPSTHQAHIIPQGFIANEVVLPLGAECDSCNGYASKLENAFLHHDRIWLPIMVEGVPGRDRRARKRLGRAVRTGENALRFSGKAGELSIDGNRVELNLAPAPEYDHGKFRRALYHIAFNYIAFERGVGFALKSEFDPVRRYVKAAKRSEYWSYGQVSYPEIDRSRLEIRSLQDAPGVIVRLRSYLDDFYVDLLNSGAVEKWAAASGLTDFAMH
jgi:hypothetical protein